MLEKITLKQCTELNKKLSQIEEHVMIRVFDIIKQNDVQFTQNSNAIFFSEDHLTDKIFNQINDYVNEEIENYNLYRKNIIKST